MFHKGPGKLDLEQRPKTGHACEFDTFSDCGLQQFTDSLELKPGARRSRRFTYKVSSAHVNFQITPNPRLKRPEGRDPMPERGVYAASRQKLLQLTCISRSLRIVA